MFEKELAALQENNLIRRPLTVQSPCGPWMTVDGRKVLNLCSNDYLGLANHPNLREAAHAALDRFGCGSGASRLVTGTHTLHCELEKRLAHFKRTEAALLFNSGYAANTGIIPALINENDVVLSDSLNHASIIDGCRLSRAVTHVYPHKDMNVLDDLLQKTKSRNRRVIVTDGVFSMDGDIAPLPDIVSLAERHDALVMVDDAHATGVLGTEGTGTVEHFGLQGRIAVQMGTLGKALGSFGAYVAGDQDLIEYLMNRARSYMFSTSLPAAVCAASLAALDIVKREPERRERLWSIRKRLVDGMRSIGVSVGGTESPIVPIMISGADRAMKAQGKLLERGILATAIRYPTVSKGAERLRLTVTATHDEADIDTALHVLGECWEEGVLS